MAVAMACPFKDAGTITDFNGHYKLQLPPGNYELEFQVLDDHKLTIANAGDDTADSDARTMTKKGRSAAESVEFGGRMTWPT